MVDVAKTVEIVFSGTDRVTALTSKVGTQIESLGDSAGNTVAAFANVADGVIKFQAALAALAAGGLVVAFNKAKQLEAATIELQKVLGDNESVDTATDKALGLSDAYGQSSTEILGSMANFRQAGFDLEESMQLSKTAMDLVIAGGLEADDASRALVSTIKGFGLEASEATRIIDILNETSNNYATDVEQLSQGMARISPIASQMGFSMEETAGLLTPIIEIFGSGSEAANALRTGLLKLTDDSKPVADALATLGVSQRDANGELRTGKEIYYDVAAAMQNLSPAQQTYLTQQLVGIEQAPKMTLAFKELAKVQDITATAMNSAGSAAKEVAVRLESAEVAVDRFKAGFSNLAAAIGDEFLESSKGVINGATDIENALRGLVDAGTFDPVLDLVKQFAENIGETLSDVAENLPAAFELVDFGPLTDGIKAFAGEFGKLFEGVDLDTPEGLAEVIQNIVNTLGGFEQVAAGVVKGLAPFIEGLKVAVSNFSEMDVDGQQLIGTVAGFAKGISEVAKLLSAGGQLLAGLGEFGQLIIPGGVISLGLHGLITVLSGPAGIGVAIVGFATGVVKAIDALSDWSMEKYKKELQESNKLTFEAEEKIISFYKEISNLPTTASTVEIYAAVDRGDFDEARRLIDEAKEVSEEKVEVDFVVEVEDKQLEDYIAKIDKLPQDLQTEFYTNVDQSNLAEVEDFIKYVEEEKNIPMGLTLDPESKQKVETEILSVTTESGEVHEVEVKVKADGVDKVKEDVKEVTGEKLLEIKLQGQVDTQIAQIEANALSIQSAFEYKATVDVAEIEAMAGLYATTFASIDNTINSTASLIGQSLDALGDPDSFEQKWSAQDVLRQEQEYREQAMELQKAQIEQANVEIELLRQKAEAFASGDAIIKIDSTGLEPTLDALFMKVLEKCQVEISSVGGDLLLEAL